MKADFGIKVLTLLWGGVLLFGCPGKLPRCWVATSAVSQRDVLNSYWASGRAISSEKRSSNPFGCSRGAAFGRFIVRRCFFPYALVVFALLGIMNVAFLLSVVGANLVWPVALYSATAFAGGPAATVTPHTVSAEA